jgi:hypothetical protein
MSVLDCGHATAGEVRRICRHLLGTRDAGYSQRFTGKGKAFDLVCGECGRHPAGIEENLRTVCPECYRGVTEQGSWEGIIGRPEIAERETPLSFHGETTALPDAPREPILDVKPVEAFDRNLWVAVTQAGELLSLDLDHRSVQPHFRLPETALNLSEPVSLHLGAAGRIAAVVNTKGRGGVVLDVEAGKVTMTLDRGEYHNEHCTFPVAFFETDGRTLLIHGTDWNRLDVSDPRTGALLTDRAPTRHAHGQTRPEHYLDYFHCGLSVSPGQEYVADNGWVWGPVGAVRAWDLRRWLRDNVWESEDGRSAWRLCYRYYFWDGPLCWVGDRRLAVWGYGEDDDWLIPAVRLFDVSTGQEEGWFPGPKGSLVFDEYLFSSDAEQGTSVWDVGRGERLLRDESFRPFRYHRGAKCFLTLRPDGLFEVGRLRGCPVDPSWLSWGGGTVARVAGSIADAGAFDELPVLADALEEAGCRDQAVLAHCRHPGPHGGRCWVIDRILEDQ